VKEEGLVTASQRFLNPSEAAARLGVSTKALRLYEQHGLIKPIRTAAGWRTYGTAELARAAEIAALRALGLSLAQVGRVLQGNPASLEPALATHQSVLENRAGELAAVIEKVRALRADLAQGKTASIGELARLVRPATDVLVAFNLPWPWGGERFELRDIRQVNYIVGPLGSGKTRLARAIAENLPKASFIGMERLANGCAEAHRRMQLDPALKSRVDQISKWLTEDGAVVSPALVSLLVALEFEDATTLVIDMVEQGLDHATQEALIAYLRHRGPKAASLFVLTRSNAILDLAGVGEDETIILCPANHAPPTQVAPYPGAPGYDAVATCLASPEVRARTEGVTATLPRAFA
jgi:DNA-binding transcriptional MerR regulator